MPFIYLLFIHSTAELDKQAAEGKVALESQLSALRIALTQEAADKENKLRDSLNDAMQSALLEEKERGRIELYGIIF